MNLFGWFKRRRQKHSSLPIPTSARRIGEFDEDSGDRPIVLPKRPTDAGIRAAVAAWIELMACGEYAKAVRSVFREPPSPEDFRERVETFCIELEQVRQQVITGLRDQSGMEVRGPSPPKVPVPRTRAKVVSFSRLLDDTMEIHREEISSDSVAYVGFHLPLDNGFGIWTTMNVRREHDRCVLEFEIFHL